MKRPLVAPILSIILFAYILSFVSCTQKYTSSYPPKDPQKRRIACVGNSITEGFKLMNPQQEAYPAQLQAMLGEDGYEVLNFGVSAVTVMETDLAYTKTIAYQEALASKPDVVIIMLGTNDSYVPHRAMVEKRFVKDYDHLVKSFSDLDSKPRIILAYPPASFVEEEDSFTQAAIEKHIIPNIKKVADQRMLEVVDVNAATADHRELFPDDIHPDREGARIIASTIADVIKPKP